MPTTFSAVGPRHATPASVTGAIVGGRKSPQVDEMAGAADWDLDPGVLAEVDTLLAQRLAKIPG